ncbi:MAG: sulfatase family protein [Egibacteraceae bacterium]
MALTVFACSAERVTSVEGARPNIVVVMTDDQTVESVQMMPNVKRLLGEQGVTFRNSFASFPLCCPSRATFLTGQYSHNHGVLSNLPQDNGGYYQLDNTNTLPVWLQASGYRTTHIGKYLHAYGTRDPTEVPPGWTEWYGTIDYTTYFVYDYEVNENGVVRTYGHTAKDYQTDVHTRRALEVIRRQAPGEQPFFLSIAFLAPHASRTSPSEPNYDSPPDAAPRHSGAFANEPLPMPPSFNEADVSDKPQHIQGLPVLDEAGIEEVTASYRARLASLLAVDEAVGEIVRTLDEVGELDNTYLLFTSDNGFLHGEHRLPTGKVVLYEESIRVPLIVRGPRAARRATSETMVANIDLAPTIAQIAEAEPERTMDGRSLLPVLHNAGNKAPRALLIENLSNSDPKKNPKYTAIRTDRYLYAEYATGERELYDLVNDPYQLVSHHDDPAYAATRADLAARLATLRTCSGQSCH